MGALSACGRRVLSDFARFCPKRRSRFTSAHNSRNLGAETDPGFLHKWTLSALACFVFRFSVHLLLEYMLRVRFKPPALETH
jgi:hypothetical protein